MAIAAFSSFFGNGTNNSAELKAIMEGIRLCKRLLHFNVIIKSDSRIVVDWLRKGRCSLWYLWDFWEDLVAELVGVNFMVFHQYREGNSVDDFLAKEGARGKNIFYDDQLSLPRFLQGPIKNFNSHNQRGFSFPPSYEGGYRRFDRGKAELTQKYVEEVGKDMVNHDASSSMIGSSGSPKKVQVDDVLMAAVDKGEQQSVLGSRSAVKDTYQSIEEVEVLLSTGKERRVINAKEVEEEMCTLSILKASDILDGSDSVRQVYPTQSDGPELNTHYYPGMVYVPIRPSVGPSVRTNVVSSSHSLSNFDKMTGSDPRPTDVQVGVGKFGGKQPRYHRKNIEGRVTKSLDFKRGKRKIDEVNCSSHRESSKSRRVKDFCNT
ncbi:hypothetical protein LWI29_015201 [Acer saccharum]|uniref:RNase H type-1 domain-containing protein n=1 Tax=Acer saccharum TaxID=4024 RepID=A0AA39VZ29_ACESA|nr:hypothetical protein LWI29_015201 [Acer saccharum]